MLEAQKTIFENHIADVAEIIVSLNYRMLLEINNYPKAVTRQQIAETDLRFLTAQAKFILVNNYAMESIRSLFN